MVADEADVGALAHELHAAVGIGAVAHHVAEAPELVDTDLVGIAENRLESGQVGVDVAEYGYSHGRVGRHLGDDGPGLLIVGGWAVGAL